MNPSPELCERVEIQAFYPLKDARLVRESLSNPRYKKHAYRSIRPSSPQDATVAYLHVAQICDHICSWVGAPIHFVEVAFVFFMRIFIMCITPMYTDS